MKLLAVLVVTLSLTVLTHGSTENDAAAKPSAEGQTVAADKYENDEPMENDQDNDDDEDDDDHDANEEEVPDSDEVDRPEALAENEDDGEEKVNDPRFWRRRRRRHYRRRRG